MSTATQPELKTVGDRIRWARLARGWYQKDLAAVLRIKPPTIHHWEVNDGDPKVSTIVRIAHALSVPPHWLAFGGPLPLSVQPSEEMLASEGPNSSAPRTKRA